MSYEIIWEPRSVIKRYSGLLTNDDMIQSVIDIEKDPRFDELRYVINDFLATTSVSLTKDIVEDVSVMDRGAACTNPNIRIAVVTSLPEIKALATLYANSPLNAFPTKIFSTLGEARSWLADKSESK